MERGPLCNRDLVLTESPVEVKSCLSEGKGKYGALGGPAIVRIIINVKLSL
jgi:hypothetical protein